MESFEAGLSRTHALSHALSTLYVCPVSFFSSISCG